VRVHERRRMTIICLLDLTRNRLSKSHYRLYDRAYDTRTKPRLVRVP